MLPLKLIHMYSLVCNCDSDNSCWITFQAQLYCRANKLNIVPKSLVWTWKFSTCYGQQLKFDEACRLVGKVQKTLDIVKFHLTLQDCLVCVQLIWLQTPTSKLKLVSSMQKQHRCDKYYFLTMDAKLPQTPLTNISTHIICIYFSSFKVCRCIRQVCVNAWSAEQLEFSSGTTTCWCLPCSHSSTHVSFYLPYLGLPSVAVLAILRILYDQ